MCERERVLGGLCSTLLGVDYEVLKVSFHSWLVLSDLLAENHSYCNSRLGVLDRRFGSALHGGISTNATVAYVSPGVRAVCTTIPASAR